MIFFAGRGFNAAVDVHGLRGGAGDGFRNVFFLQAPGKDEGMDFFHLDGKKIKGTFYLNCFPI